MLAVAFLIYTMRDLLVFGKTTLVHDNLVGTYPIFQFFAENIVNGHFPFWNPFEHAGEPFYPLLGQARLLEPLTLLVIYFGKFVSNDIIMLFNWNRFVQGLVTAFGVYIVFRPLSKHLFIRLSLIPILLYSSFMLGSFRQDTVLYQFFLIPFITYFLLRIMYYKDHRWYNWLFLASLIGLNWQSYFFTGTWIFLLFFSVGTILFRKDLLAELFKARMIMLKLGVMVFIVFAMAMPNIVLMLEKDRYVFPGRMVDTSSKMLSPQGSPFQYETVTSSTMVSGIKMPYSLINFTGTFSSIWDFIQIISPDGNRYIGWRSRIGWGNPSEAYMYLGFLPWAIAILGLVAARHDLKRVWLLILISFGLLMLGPPGGLHRILYYIYPPMWFVRHTHAFVLSFTFALLYFYILGFNHILFTWRGIIFQHYKSQGILSRYIKNDKVCKVAAFFVFSACMVVSVYSMRGVKYPATNYLFGFIALIVAIGWFLRKDLGEKGLYIGLIVSHIAIVLIFSRNTFKFVEYIAPVLGLPVASLLFVKYRKKPSKGLEYYSPVILLCIFSIALVGDLVYSLQKSSSLYKGEKHLMRSLNIKTTPQPPFLPQNRLIEARNYAAISERGIRFLSVLYRQPFVFSPMMDPDYSGSYVHVRNIFNGLTNKSFEKWVVSQAGNLLPEQFAYHQEGSGGAVERYIGYDGVKDGNASVLLIPPSTASSHIKYQTSQIEELRGQYIRLSVWVKSQNKSRRAIRAEVQVDDGEVALRFYNNSGDWEHLVIGKYIDRDATKLTVRCRLNSSATAPVYLDGFTIEIVEIKPEFESVLKAKRWNSILALKKYFELIYMDIPSLAMEEMFAVGKPMFQIKQGIVQVKESEAQKFLKQLGDAKSAGLLREAVLVDDQVDQSLIRFRKLPKEYQNVNQSPALMGNCEGSRDVSIGDEKNKFTYTIETYNYDSFEMKASADNDGILYWADGYDKNWHAYINGKEVPVYRANINFKAISIPKGTSKIYFIYNPFLYKIGLFIFYGTLLLCILAAVIMNGCSMFTRKLKSIENLSLWQKTC
jgi:hypothetical protein